ncbi:MAG TPA: hypothetical protein VGM82_00100 [Gemmatimonadaceae bacterium]|jgi:hypothetical protein
MRTLAMLLIAGLMVACGGDSSTAPTVDNSFIGSFTLKTINGQRLPYVIAQSGNNSVTVTVDHMVIADGGSWTEVATYTVVTNGTSVTQIGGGGGTWIRTGNALGLTDGATNQLSYTGTFANGTLTMNGAGSTDYTFVWSR